ncbi:hypothetical protein LUD75_08955 [Epilithonimonas sp. JDS]|uniref:hypothetical protein n=1 Tax=Epilithonimonas sp. JDS TaxID=2902797 RepID=UPI001E529E3F|nr:hypothetical protein [Epilithonimonas sp. JDS]MCD9854833.1 hypothetical protein [Epilithonimonas sp. JDS]
MIIILIIGCASVSTDYRYDKTEKGELYFPTFDETKYPRDTINTGPNDSLRSFTNNWYSKHLFTLNEPVLFNKINEKQNTIRFTHLGTWSNPYSYRLENIDGKIILTYNRTNGLGGYEVGKRVRNKTKQINSKKWNAILQKIDSIDFWNISTQERKNINDGEEWILEVLINGKYHFVTRTSPDSYDQGKDFVELCQLIEKSGK